SVEENAGLMQPFLDDRAMLQSRLTASLETLKSQPEVDNDRIAAIGYCFGGLCVLDLARIGTDINGVASFHGLFGAPGNTAGTKIKAKVLALHGHEDPMVPVDAVVALEKELTEAGADWQIHVYGNTLHAFTNPEANFPDLGAIYNKSADNRSWQTLLNFLEELF
ncbi:MAG: dienelactone hydrolase family protein, partial [Gammaproteobacteria bacterium]|nr:dienelactone hydrolase family protein [Gammaproteobacteria bacterium]